ncbi:TusE/DsrC/DsvC family sulfur relay protein [Desulfosarcina ovata]|uniref:Sulfurtransferase TusE n=1 Tax=Desulfosarcina ovata subsp. ovata TaxID=2752305 RepID=A0A5K8A925_9BACT|nr:TusE/DsrC/DsvC family sulfur relay protein [Desulfosarcina ovata]BBO88928.1 sulfurtransferase TusE [Desulfosarcina ovata subsp. ovata]
MTDAVPSAKKKLHPVVRTFGGRDVLFDNEGFFNDYEDWDEDIAGVLACESGIATLTDAHWRVIRFLREFYLGHGRAPLNKQLKKGTGMTLVELERLFPDGIKNGARRIAGLPNPKSCT